MPTPEKKGRQCNRCAGYFDDTTIEGAVHLASCKQYNGYVNYETWAVTLWIDNEEDSYNFWRERARELEAEKLDEVAGMSLEDEDEDDATPDDVKAQREAARKEAKEEARKQAIYALAGELKDSFEERFSEIMDAAKVEASVFHDLMNAALCEVNWDDVAESRFEE